MAQKSIISKDVLCPTCSNPAKKNGSFVRKRNRAKVQRFFCHSCSLAFSKQSTNITSRQHRPDLNEKIFHMICNGMGVRRIAMVLNTTPKTVQNKIKFLAILCDHFHNTHFTNWKVKPTFQFDEMWAVESNSNNALTIPLVVEKESYFIVSARSAHTNALKGTPTKRGANNARRQAKISVRDLVIIKTLDKANTMKPDGRIVMDTDKKVAYLNILEKVYGPRLVHNKYNAGIPEEAIRLFPINNTMACMRAEVSKVKRDGWYLTKDNTWLNAHLAIYTVYYNYFRIKKYTISDYSLSIVSVGGNGIGRSKKKFENKTPAMKLGIFDKPISFKFLLEQFKPKAIPTSKSPTLLRIGHNLPTKKTA